MNRAAENYVRSLPLWSDVVGEDAEETDLLLELGRKAVGYVSEQNWCSRVLEARLGLGVGGIVGVFFVTIEPLGEVDANIWVIVGDLPFAYLVPDASTTAEDALATYCALMEQWIDAVNAGSGLEGVFPIDAPATQPNADALRTRVEFLRREVLKVRQPA